MAVLGAIFLFIEASTRSPLSQMSPCSKKKTTPSQHIKVLDKGALNMFTEAFFR
jgi:hypothetical protein